MSTTRYLLIAALLASAGNAVAASSVDLSVKGSITPSACVPALSKGGVVDFGKLSAKDLRVEVHTRLPSQYMQFTVTCEAPTLVALIGTDNREGTEWLDEGNYGLGLINGNEKLGSFWVILSSAVADGVPARFIQSTDGGSSWMPDGSLWHGNTTSVADTTSLVPMPVQVLTGDMDIRAFIAPTNTLTLTEEVPIDGSITMTVRYL